MPRASNRVRLAEVERGTGLQAGWVLGVTPPYMGLRVSRLSGIRVFGVVGVVEWSSARGEGTAGMPVSGAQYAGDGAIRLRGEDVRPPGVGPEVLEAAGRAEEVRR